MSCQVQLIVWQLNYVVMTRADLTSVEPAHRAMPSDDTGVPPAWGGDTHATSSHRCSVLVWRRYCSACINMLIGGCRDYIQHCAVKFRPIRRLAVAVTGCTAAVTLLITLCTQWISHHLFLPCPGLIMWFSANDCCITVHQCDINPWLIRVKFKFWHGSCDTADRAEYALNITSSVSSSHALWSCDSPRMIVVSKYEYINVTSIING